jgi:prepilin signal peptidase PulO-like enzyme (type II secretory pathway)
VTALLAVVEAGMATFGAYVFWRFPSIAQATAALVVTALLVTVAIVDFGARRIPDLLCLALAAWGAVQMVWLGRPTLRSLALGVAAGGGLFLLIAFAKRGAMGAGDVKLAAALGAVLGYPLVLWGLFWGIVAGGLAALFLLATGRAGRKDTMAYGPYLALGAWLTWTHSLGLWP